MSIRAQRLGVSMLMFGLVREPPREAMEATFPLLYADEVEAWRDGDEDDMQLANACLTVEAERRARQWAALEAVLPALANGRTLRDDLVPNAHLAGVRQLLALGWSEVPTEGRSIRRAQAGPRGDRGVRRRASRAVTSVGLPACAGRRWARPAPWSAPTGNRRRGRVTRWDSFHANPSPRRPGF